MAYLAIIHVILAEPEQMSAMSIGVMSVSPLITNFNREYLYKRVRIEPSLVMGFLDEDLVGTTQPHVDALAVTVRIKGFDVYRVMVDGGKWG